MNKWIKHAKILLLLIFLLGTFLRFYQLGINPPSLDWDEVSLGYNAYSILKTGADEYGTVLPLSIRSFDDYKPPLYVYLTVPSVALFGLNELSVRLPSAILGSLLVLVIYFLVKELFSLQKIGLQNSEKLTEVIALLSAFFVAISPWSLQFSRAAFEGNVGIFFFSAGILLLLKGLKQQKLLIVSTLCFVLSMYSYHSFRLITPIFLLISLFIFPKELLKNKIVVLLCTIILFVSCIPIFSTLLNSQGAGSRLGMVTLFGPSPNLDHTIEELQYDRSKNDILGELFHNRRIVYSLAITKGYFDHFTVDFLFLHGDGGRQHHAVNVGMLYLFEFPFILMGIYFLIRNISKRLLLLLLWLFIAPFASAITTGTPHPVRAIAMMPPLHILTAFGIVMFVGVLTNIKRSVLNIAINKIVYILIFILFAFNFLYYLHQYYIHTPIEYGDFWQYGNKEAVEFIAPRENNYSKIIMSYKYDQPYIYYLFHRKIDPVWYQKNWDSNKNGAVDRMKRVIGKYEFRNINYGEDKAQKNTLLIGSPDEIPAGEKGLLYEIKFPNGEVAYRIVETGK